MGACTFNPDTASVSDGSIGNTDGPRADAETFFLDGGACTPGAKRCVGQSLETCNAAGSGIDDEASVLCDFTCDSARCVHASNLPDVAIAACDDQASPLTPPAGATLTMSGSIADLQIDCSPNCGQVGTTQIPNVGSVDLGGQTLVHFCLSEINIPSDVVLNLPPHAASIALFSHGSVVLEGSINAAGQGATSNNPGVGGPGGGRGGESGGDSGGQGNVGEGTCGGSGGTTDGEPSNFAAGGGGGGGGGGAGGGGGSGISPQGNFTSAGGSGGTSCMTENLAPLMGGSGGGSGADGSCGGNCSWPGGGGGGALQISSRVSISFTGSFDASGGSGFGETSNGGGGAGGGGAGGAILIEAPVVNLGASIAVTGGTGGDSGGGTGGSSGVNGTSAINNGDGGGGGGGASGRIRINSGNEATCAGTITPANACTTGPLRSTP